MCDGRTTVTGGSDKQRGSRRDMLWLPSDRHARSWRVGTVSEAPGRTAPAPDGTRADAPGTPIPQGCATLQRRGAGHATGWPPGTWRCLDRARYMSRRTVTLQEVVHTRRRAKPPVGTATLWMATEWACGDGAP